MNSAYHYFLAPINGGHAANRAAGAGDDAPESIVLPRQVTTHVRFEELLTTYIQARRNQLPQVRAALEGGDHVFLAGVGKSLAETAASYGLPAVSLLGRQVHRAAVSGSSQLLNDLLHEYEDFLATVQVTYRNSVLFVEEDNHALGEVKALFAESEYIKHYARDAREALEILERELVDVLVSDLVLPGPGGLGLLSRIRDRYPNTVRIVLSAHEQAPSVLAAIRAGHIFRYINRPWSTECEVLSAVADAVEYANILNEVRPGGITVSLETILAILQKAHAAYVVVSQAGIPLSSSAELAPDFPVGDILHGNQLLVLGNMHRIELGRFYTLYMA